MGPRAAITDVIIDCVDPVRLAAFWAKVLDRQVGTAAGPYVVLRRRSEDDLVVAFQRVPEEKAGKNRVHFDVSCEDIAATKALVESLGGRRVGGYEEGGFLVMADPEDNEFCLVPFSGIQVDEAGRATYLDGTGLDRPG